MGNVVPFRKPSTPQTGQPDQLDDGDSMKVRKKGEHPYREPKAA